MVNFFDLRDADPGVYARQADKWRNITQRTEERGNDVQRHLDGLADWTGPASEKAKLELGVLRASLHGMTAELAKIPPVLTTLHETIAGLQRQLVTIVQDAVGRGFRFSAIDEDGTVHPIVLTGQTQRDVRTFAAELTATFRDLIRRANEADTEAADALRKLTAEAAGFAPSSDFDDTTGTTIPARGTPAEDVLKWWNGLSAQQREALLFNHADIIGAVDGIPATVRDRANRSLLPGLTEQTREQIARLDAKIPKTSADQEQLTSLREKLSGLEGISNRLNAPVDARHPEAFLLKIGTDGTGRAIVAVGNPDTADNVSTYVPGTGTRVGQAQADISRADIMESAAYQHDPSSSTAVITWMDYEAPQEIFPDAAGSGYAEKASGDLRNFEHGLRVTHDDSLTGGPSHSTLIGHSYGGEVVGITARDGAVDADALVFVAAPSAGVDHPGGLHLTGVDSGQMDQRVYHTVGDNDPMRYLSQISHEAPDYPGHPGIPGQEPVPPSPPFGGIAFGSDHGTGHSDYWNVDQRGRMNTSLDAMGKIIVGQPL